MTNDDKEMLANAILITCAICLAIVAWGIIGWMISTLFDPHQVIAQIIITFIVPLSTAFAWAGYYKVFRNDG